MINLENLDEDDIKIIEKICDEMKIPVGIGRRNTIYHIISKYKGSLKK